MKSFQVGATAPSAQRRSRHAAFGWIGAVWLAASALGAPNAHAGEEGVTLSQDCNHGGTSVTLTQGKYGVKKLRRKGLEQDTISSVRVPPGYTVTLFDQPDFKGRTLVLTSSVACLTNSGFDNVTSSVRIVAGNVTLPTPTPTPLPTPQPTPGRQAPASPHSGGGIVLTQDCEFGGTAVRLEPGQYSLSDLQQRGIRNDDVSAARIYPGYSVTLYEHDHFQGRTLNLSANDSCFVDNDFNDIVSSVIVRSGSSGNAGSSQNPPQVVTSSTPPGATITQHCDYQGYGAQLPPGRYRLSQLQQLGVSNDDISAVKVNPGYSVTLYEDDNFQGRTLNLSSSDSCLTGENFNDLMSSIEVRVGEPPQAAPPKPTPAPVAAGITVTEHCNYGGYKVLLPAGSYSLTAMANRGIPNDTISAIRVPKGYQVMLFEDAGFTGDVKLITGDDSCLVNQGFNDKTSSIKVLKLF